MINIRGIITIQYGVTPFPISAKYNDKEDNSMTDTSCNLLIGRSVPDFKLETFEPAKGDFGEFALAAQKTARKWTVLFFYPADFTFV